ncbi:AGAP006899-PA-like protein [Anopheles sinensis]|uniref:AGAP006899-PA-like protein n=1 Tax=Anopheles sinensis TaxID=74873 RepID=A0A084VDY8_ANOSI|nr:AGAP006899-PA-like protein [Anopheles sinensis]
MTSKWFPLLAVVALHLVSAAPLGGNSTELSKTIGVIHHLTYLIDYLVQYVIKDNDRKTPKDAADYYQKALVEGQSEGAVRDSEEYKPSADRARQETEIISKMMNV